MNTVLCVAALLLGQSADVDDLIKKLGAPDFLEQGRAAKSLEILGPVAVGQLRSFEGDRDVQAWCRRIADRIDANSGRFRGLIEKLGSDDDEVKDAAEREILKAGAVAIAFLRRVETENKNLRLRADKLIGTLSSDSETVTRLWSHAKTNDWMPVPIRSLGLANEAGPRIVIQAPKGGDEGRQIRIPKLPMSWDEVSGVQVRVGPGDSSHAFVATSTGTPPTWHILGVQMEEPLVFYSVHAPGDPKAAADKGLQIERAQSYELRVEQVGKRLKFSVGALVVKTVDLPEAGPTGMRLIVNDGKSEFFDLKVRKR